MYVNTQIQMPVITLISLFKHAQNEHLWVALTSMAIGSPTDAFLGDGRWWDFPHRWGAVHQLKVCKSLVSLGTYNSLLSGFRTSMWKNACGYCANRLDALIEMWRLSSFGESLRTSISCCALLGGIALWAPVWWVWLIERLQMCWF